MKKLIALALAASTTMIAAAPAAAADGCGRGYFRGPHGHCHPERRRFVAPGLVIGNFYVGHGYWDGHRYYQHRERYRDGWRYR